MAKKRGQGWDSGSYNKDRRDGLLQQEQQNVREWQRSQQPPYNPANEKVMGVVGEMMLDRAGRNKISVEFVSYEGTGPWRLQVIKRGTNREGKEFSTSLGRLHPDQAEQLAAMLRQGVDEAEKHNPSRGQ